MDEVYFSLRGVAARQLLLLPKSELQFLATTSAEWSNRETGQRTFIFDIFFVPMNSFGGVATSWRKSSTAIVSGSPLCGMHVSRNVNNYLYRLHMSSELRAVIN